MEPIPRRRGSVSADTPEPPAPAGTAPAPTPPAAARVGKPGQGPRVPASSPAPGQALDARNVLTGRHFLALSRAVHASVGDAQASVRVLSKIVTALEEARRWPSFPDPELAPLRRAVIDLSRLFPADAACLSLQVGRCLEQMAREQGLALTGVMLPRCMDRVPPALAALPKLSLMQLPDFQGTAIDTRELRPDGGALEVRVQGAPRLVHLHRRPRHEVRVMGNNFLRLQEWVVPWPEREASPRPKGRKGTAGGKGAVKDTGKASVKAEGEDPLKNPGSGPAPAKLEGRFYARVDRDDHADATAYLADHAATLSTNLNFAATFTGTLDPIVCRHLALAVLYERLQWEAGSPGRRPREGRFDFRKFSTPQAIAQAIGPEWEGIYQRLAGGARLNHLVALPRMGEFLDHQFRSMRAGQSRYFLYGSVNHQMTLRIRLKERPDAGPVRVVAVYDPNRTTTHFRQVVSGTGPLHFDFAQALGPSGHAEIWTYFDRDPRGWIALLQEVTLADFEAARAGRSPAEAAGHPRELDAAFLPGGAGRLLTPTEVVLRWHAAYLDGLEEALLASLARIPPGAGRLTLLRGEGVGGKNILSTAWALGRRDWVRAVLGAAVRARLTREERIALLQGPTGPYLSLLSEICSAQSLDGIDLFFEAIRMLGLDAPAKTLLLGAQDIAGYTALDYAIVRGAPTTGHLVKAVLALDGDGFDCLSVLAATLPQRPTSLVDAVTHGKKEVVGEFARLVLESGLDDLRIRKILVPGDRAWLRQQLDGQPETADVLFKRLDASTQFQVSLDLAVPDAGPGERAGADRLLAPYGERADLSRVRGSMDPAEVRQFIARLHAILRSGLPVSDKVDLLASADSQGRPLLYRLMAINAHLHVEALAKAMRCFEFSAYRDSLLEARATGEGLSAFSRALQEGNLLAIQVWMRQVLISFQAAPVSEVEREYRLLGLPPGARAKDHAKAVAALRATPFTLGGWAREVASATPQQLAPATQRRLLALVGREDLLRAREGKATRAPAPGR